LFFEGFSLRLSTILRWISGKSGKKKIIFFPPTPSALRREKRRFPPFGKEKIPFLPQ